MNETDELNAHETHSDDDSSRPRRRIHPGLLAAGVVAAVLLLALLFWMFGRSGGEAGRPVPAPRTSMDDAPAETIVNQTMTLSPEQIANAGIEIGTVGEVLSAESEQVSAAATVEANAYKQTPAMAVAGGVVRRVIPELGDNVRAGQAVAVVFSSEFADAQARYLTLQTEADNARRNFERTQRLVIINQPGRSELEQAARLRKAAEAAVFESRNRYERTLQLVQLGAASREQLEQDTARYRTAEAELDEARLRETRAGQLLPISAEVRQASEEAAAKLRSTEGELAAARQRLVLFGMSSSRLNALQSTSQITSEMSVPAPVTGTVTARSVNVGEVIEPNKELMKITDLTSVWVIAQVFERDLARLRVGSGASITAEAFPGRLFRGHVTYIDPQVDETTRTAKVRIEVDNPGRALKLGMFVRAAFGSLGQAERTLPAVPESAVQTLNGRQIVFVPTAESGTFELRPVRLGSMTDGRYPVIEGLNVGDRVVTSGSFMLRAEWLKSHQGQH